jgi:SHS2 domain-containing protein
LTSKPAPASHRPLDHTADLGVEIDAPSREALFGEAAIALADTLTDVSAVAPAIERRLELEGQDDELLLVDFLSEVLFLFETEGFVVAAAAVELEGGGASTAPVRLRATLHGAEYDEDEHPLRSLVKAVTYHGLRIWRDGERYRARVLFDL